MSRSGENIHKRKDGRWEARLQLVDEEGVKRSRSLYGKTYREAKNKLLDARQHGYNRKKESPFFEEVAWEWLRVQRAEHKGATVLKYATIIDRHLIVTFGRIKINQITEQMIRCFLLEKKTSGNLVTGKPLSASYLKLILVVLTAILNYAAQKNYCVSVKDITIGHISPPRKEADCLNHVWQQKLEQYIRKNINENTTGIALALYAGLRLGEVCALAWNDIDFENNLIYVKRTISRVINDDDSKNKTKLIISEPKTQTSKRIIPITSKLRYILSTFNKSSKSNFVVSTGESFVSPRTFEYRFHSVLQKCEIGRINFHGLRHTFASQCIEVGIDAKTLSEILGHASVDITLNTYVHSSIRRKQHEIEKLSEIVL